MSLELLPYPEDFEQANATTTSPPAHWRTTRIKYLLREIDDRSPTGTEVLLSMRQTLGLVPHNDVSDKPIAASALIGYKRVVPGDIVVNRMRASTGMVAAAPASGLVSPDYAVFRPIDDVDTAYLTLLFKSPAMQTAFRIESKGLGTGSAGFLRLYSDRFAAITIPVPSRFEQGTIVAFVRSWDRRITRLIRAKRRQIELLNEQKQAIIHQAVTRGLDPAVPLKPSGVDWLGDVPAHWDIRKLKFVAEEIVGGSTPSTGAPEYWDGDIVWVTPQDVSASATLVDSKRHITQRGLEACSSTLMPAGTIVVTSRAPVGNVAFAAIPLTTNQGCKAIIPERSRLDQRYAFRLLQVLKPELQSLAKGTTFTEISTTQIANVKVPVPPVDEQRSLVAVIASETQLTDQSIGLAEREIDLIREYRTRLIADVVTGKLDVRGAELPELDEAGDAAWDETDDELGEGEIEDDDIDD